MLTLNGEDTKWSTNMEAMQKFSTNGGRKMVTLYGTDAKCSLQREAM